MNNLMSIIAKKMSLKALPVIEKITIELLVLDHNITSYGDRLYVKRLHSLYYRPTPKQAARTISLSTQIKVTHVADKLIMKLRRSFLILRSKLAQIVYPI